MTEQKDIKETEYRRQKGTTSDTSRRRNKKNAEVTFIILVILIILISIIVYITHQYNSGMKYAKEHAKDVKVHKFNGNMKMMGRFQFLSLARIRLKVVNHVLTRL